MLHWKYLSGFHSETWWQDTTNEWTCYVSCFGSKEITLILSGKIWNSVSKGMPQFLYSPSAVEGACLLETYGSLLSAMSVGGTGYGSACFRCALGRDSSWLWERESLPFAFFHEKVCLLLWKVTFQLWSQIYHNFSVISFWIFALNTIIILF